VDRRGARAVERGNLETRGGPLVHREFESQPVRREIFDFRFMILDLRSGDDILRRRWAGLRMQVFLAFIRSPPAEQALLGQGDQVVDIQKITVRHSISGLSQ